MYNPDEECKAMTEVLKRICEDRNVSVYALSKESGISKSTISYLMNGKTNPRIYTLLILCNTLGVTIRSLFENEGAEDKKTSDMGEVGIEREEILLLQSYRRLSEDKRELLKIFMEMLFQYKYEIL